VAEELNFSRAAKRLRMAQPPLSVAIRQLEQEIDATLFHRTSREVKLTEAGEALLVGARRTLAEAEGAVLAAKRTAAGELGMLRIGYSWTARFETLPALGRALMDDRPDVELVGEEMRTYLMPAALRMGTIDVALALYPDVVGELSYQTIRRERIVAVVSSRHPLADKQTLRLEELADDLVLFPRYLAPRLHDFYLGLCRRSGFEPQEAEESTRTRWTIGAWNPPTAVVLPASVHTDLPEGTVAIALSDPADRIENQLVWRADDQNPLVHGFIALSTGVFAEASAAPA
jgi:DNA-binding transcriptional LysR family regulator